MRHPGRFRHWATFGGKLLVGKLPARDRELLILRTGWRCRSEYEWGQHVLIGKATGLTDEEIERVKRGPDAPGWDPFDATLLRAADELHDDHSITDATWNALASRYDERQLIEVPMLVGQYHLVAFTLNSLGVQRDAGVPGVRRVTGPRLAGRRVLVVGAGTQLSDEPDPPVGNGRHRGAGCPRGRCGRVRRS